MSQFLIGSHGKTMIHQNETILAPRKFISSVEHLPIIMSYFQLNERSLVIIVITRQASQR